ncbi:MAG: N-methyl-L-tryptophan oxidase [Chitinophagaceae bacterium]|nr:N-methyl-L-tryptophan oxidase [Chitinophagaceae bacterium]
MKRREFLTSALSLPLVAGNDGSKPQNTMVALQKNQYDVIVIGAGSMGASACYFLAARGHKVLGLEQFNVPHEKGSHAGQSRIIRKAYFEHPDYVPLLERAYYNWRQIEEKTGIQLYHETGLLYHGKPGHVVLKGTTHAASLHHIPLHHLSPGQSSKQFPQFKLPEGFTSFIESAAGFITPEKAISTYIAEAVKNGASIRTNEKVLDWKKEKEHIKVVTSKETFYCKKLVVTAGAWAGKLAPQLKPQLKVTRQIVAWMKPLKPALFSLENFPCWVIADEDRGVYYGFPMLPNDRFDGPAGLKVAHHFPGAENDPDNVNRNISKEDEEDIRYALQKYLPAANGELLEFKTCLYTYSKDENFIIDHLPGYNGDVTIACGFSGHGFKFVSVVGEILADLAMEGKTKLPVDFLKLGRFVA